MRTRATRRLLLFAAGRQTTGGLILAGRQATGEGLPAAKPYRTAGFIFNSPERRFCGQQGLVLIRKLRRVWAYWPADSPIGDWAGAFGVFFRPIPYGVVPCVVCRFVVVVVVVVCIVCISTQGQGQN